MAENGDIRVLRGWVDDSLREARLVSRITEFIREHYPDAEVRVRIQQESCNPIIEYRPRGLMRWRRVGSDYQISNNQLTLSLAIPQSRGRGRLATSIINPI